MHPSEKILAGFGPKLSEEQSKDHWRRTDEVSIKVKTKKVNNLLIKDPQKLIIAINRIQVTVIEPNDFWMTKILSAQQT